jgi:hypothetical protein
LADATVSDHSDYYRSSHRFQGDFLQSLANQIVKAKGRLMLLNLSDDLPLYGAQRLLLSQSVDEFDVEVTLCINISEE